MLLDLKLGQADVYHDVGFDFGQLLRDSLTGRQVTAALGPLYATDPAEQILAPFVRSAKESDWKIASEAQLAPSWALEKARKIRSETALAAVGQIDERDAVDWTRAGLVLEIARRRGIHMSGRGVLHVNWKMRGTVTGRFGAETLHGKSGIDGDWNFNPMSLAEKDRIRIRPSDHCRHVVVIDFRAMDVCSMIALVPGLIEKYSDHPDPHTRTAELVFGDSGKRSEAKENVFVYAYGGTLTSDLRDRFRSGLPEIAAVTKGLQHGEFPRLVQSTSALAFRAALSRALPLFVGEKYLPMFTVHDEVVLDASEIGVDGISEVTKALEEGASQRIGVPYRVRVSTGYTYEEAKRS